MNFEKDNFRGIKIISGIVGIFLILVMIFYENSKEEPNFLKLGIIGGFIIIFWLVLYFGINFFKDYKSKVRELEDKAEKLPDAISIVDLKKSIKEKIESEEYRNHIKKWGEILSRDVNGNLIYHIPIKFLHNDSMLGEGCIYIVNAHFPDTRFAIRPFSENVNKINSIMNSISTKPKEDPQIEISEETVDAFGNPIRKTQKINNNNNIEEKKSEDELK